MWIAITWILILHRFPIILICILVFIIILIFILLIIDLTQYHHHPDLYHDILRKSVKARNRLTVAESIEVTV